MQPDLSAAPLATRLARSWIFWVVLLCVGLALPFARSLTRREARPLPPFLFQLPPFRLVSERGQPFGSDDLKGKVWIASFLFTSCPSICPRLVAQMKKVQERLRPLGSEIHLVSFSVDPVNDTPAKLAEYARRHGADPERWTFLTGPLGDVEAAVKRGFKLAMDPVRRSDGDRDLFDIVHGARFVLLDRGAGIRGYYEAEDEGVDRLVRDAETLVTRTR